MLGLENSQLEAKSRKRTTFRVVYPQLIFLLSLHLWGIAAVYVGSISTSIDLFNFGERWAFH